MATKKKAVAKKTTAKRKKSAPAESTPRVLSAAGKKLVIVESPAKARKISTYLGSDYVVDASVGHIRDLPQRAADIPAEYMKVAWAKEGVKIEEDFAPLYVINPDKKKKVSELKALLKDAEELILATD